MMGSTLAIVGAEGRMGARLVALAPAVGLEVGVKVDRDGWPEGPLGVDCLIDFSVAAAAAATCARAAAEGLPLVLGTTGLDAAAEAAVRAAAREVSIVRASNFSVGVTVLLDLVEKAARQLGTGWDIEIVEAHHRRKVDAPSGTALSLGEAAARGRGWALADVARHGREGLVGPREDAALGFHAVRGGTVVGTHEVGFFGASEHLTLTHRAEDRDIFARGALRAASWLLETRPAPGLYDMRDVLGLGAP
jgi:4-hydroxy-tetrahydrodipicolinate reductase